MKNFNDLWKKIKESQFVHNIKTWSENFWNKITRGDLEATKVPSIRSAALFGFIVLLIFFGGFGLWSLVFPLESAAIAPGKIIVATNRKTIQHLEGGIVKEIFVREGSVVKQGDPLIRLEDTQARANYSLWHKQANELYATQARLIAERDSHDKINFPEVLLKQQNDPDVKYLMTAQQKIFNNNEQTLKGQLKILNERINQLKNTIESSKAQLQANAKQLTFISEELKAVKSLEERKLIEKTRLWQLQREAARLEGNRGDYQGQIAQAEQKIGETQQQILTLKDTSLKDTLKSLNETDSKLTETVEKEKAAEDILRRTLIVSPQPGSVMNLQEHTIGGVITPGKAIMDIVPSQDELIVEAKLNPVDIDSVHIGLKAKVQLVAYKRRNTPWLEGTVTHVSADIFQEEDKRTTYYLARVMIPPEELKRIPNMPLYPGMPVSVMIITEKRTPFDYFITPIKDSFTKAFRER